MNAWEFIWRLDKNFGGEWTHVLVCRVNYTIVKHLMQPEWESLPWGAKEFINAREPYCSLRRFSSLQIAPSPKGVEVRWTWLEDARRMSWSSYWAPLPESRIVVVTDQGERIVALVYELRELPRMIYPEFVNMRVMNGEQEIWRTDVDLREFQKLPSLEQIEQYVWL